MEQGLWLQNGASEINNNAEKTFQQETQKLVPRRRRAMDGVSSLCNTVDGKGETGHERGEDFVTPKADVITVQIIVRVPEKVCLKRSDTQ